MFYRTGDSYSLLIKVENDKGVAQSCVHDSDEDIITGCSGCLQTCRLPNAYFAVMGIFEILPKLGK
jgi:hypothetical protein